MHQDLVCGLIVHAPTCKVCGLILRCDTSILVSSMLRNPQSKHGRCEGAVCQLCKVASGSFCKGQHLCFAAGFGSFGSRVILIDIDGLATAISVSSCMMFLMFPAWFLISRWWTTTTTKQESQSRYTTVNTNKSQACMPAQIPDLFCSH